MCFFIFYRKVQHAEAISRMQLNLHSSNKSLKETEKQVATYNKTIEEVKQCHTEVLSTKEETIKHLLTEVRALKERLAQSKDEVETVAIMETNLRAEESRNTKLVDTVAKMEREKKDALAQREADVAVLNSELASASAEVQTLRRQLLKLQQDYVHMKSCLDFELSKKRAFGGRNDDAEDEEVYLRSVDQ